MTGLVLIVLVPVGIVLLVAVLVYRGLYRRFRSTSRESRRVRFAIVSLAILFTASPYLAWKAFELKHVLARVPDPLNAIWIEYRLEKSWGFGPGGNETGFVVYRLTDGSVAWARDQGANLGSLLSASKGRWRPTPVDDGGEHNPWHPYDDDPGMMSAVRPMDHPPTIAEYLEKYGFLIPVAPERTEEADRAIRTNGSFYAYGRGGSVTIVDPARGKVYFAYAG